MVFCMVESKIPPIMYVFAFWVVKMLIYDFFFLQDPLFVEKTFPLQQIFNFKTRRL